MLVMSNIKKNILHDNRGETVERQSSKQSKVAPKLSKEGLDRISFKLLNDGKFWIDLYCSGTIIRNWIFTF